MQRLALALALSSLSLCSLCIAGGLEPSGVPLPAHLTQVPSARAQSLPEALALRRMANFLLSKELPIAQEQGAAILRQYPDSEYLDTVRSWLGDISLCQGDWQNALEHYDQITTPQLQVCRFPHRLHCHFALQDWSAIEKLSETPLWASALPKTPDTLAFYQSEALLRMQEGAKATTAGEFRQGIRARRRALALYRKMTADAYKLKSLAGQAWLCNQMGLREESESCFEELECIDPDHGNTLRFDPLRALLASCSGDYLEQLEQVPTEANWPADLDQRILQWMALSFDLGHYDLLVRDAGSFSQMLSKRAQPMRDLLYGRSFFALGQYEQSAPLFERFLESPIEDLEESAVRVQQRRNALISLFQIGSQLRRVDLLNFGIDIWLRELQPAPELAQALFCRAQLRAGNSQQLALDDLSSILAGYPSSALRPDALVGAIALASDLKHWSQCADYSVELITQYPQHPQLVALGPRIVEAIAQSIALGGDELSVRAQAILTAFQSLQKVATISPALESKWFLDLAQRLNQLECTGVSQSWLALLCTAGKERAPAANQPATYPQIFHAYVQGALEKSSDVPAAQSEATYLTLFNQCLQQLPSNDLEKSSPIEDLAATCLTKALECGGSDIKDQNLIWLGDHYYDKIFPHPLPLPTSIVADGRIDQPITYLPELSAPEQQRPLAQKGIGAYSRLLQGTEGNWQSFELSSNGLNLEQSALRCSRLLGAVGSCQEQLLVLERLQNRYELSGKTWPRQERALFELALIADVLGASPVASKAYGQVIELGVVAPQLRDWMTWRRAVHQVQSAALLQKVSQAQALQVPLKALEQLQARRVALFEPLYLEAALTWADALALCGGSTNSSEIDALDLVKKTFAQSGDIAARDYLESLKALPAPRALYFHYMTWIDAKVALLQSHGDGAPALAKRAFAISLLQFLTAQPAQAPLVEQRALKCLREIHSNGGADAQ